jgi:hypothetical protein
MTDVFDIIRLNNKDGIRMSNYRLIQYDEDSNKQGLKDFVRKNIEQFINKDKKNKEDMIEHIMFEIWQYNMKVFIAYDGAYPIGIIVCSTKTFYYHQILRFIFLEKAYQTHIIYDNILDLLCEMDDYSGLAIISKEPIEKIYSDSKFFQVRLKNPEHALIYLRTSKMDESFNGDIYFKKHMTYMKKYVSLYSALIYTSILFGASIFFLIIFSLNQSLAIYYRLLPLLISATFFVLIFVFKRLLNKHNQQGVLNFGFHYEMTYIRQFQYRFTSKTKELFSSFFQAYLDSGL